MKHGSKKIMLVAGDPSGDAHASRVVRELLKGDRGLEVFGMGGPRLAEAGMEVREDLTKEAIVGFWEVLKHFPAIRKRFRQCEDWLAREKPDLLVLVDYPGFNLRLAEKAQALGIPVCYYIAPQVWAWHRGRIHAMRRVLKKLLVIFPFEEKFFRDEKLDATYVGHPLVEVLDLPKAKRDSVLKKYGIPKAACPLIGVLPGSRGSELERIWPVLLKASRLLRAQCPDACFAVVKPGRLSHSDYQGIRPDDSIVFAEGPAYDLRAICDLTWVKSGTSTVETALLAAPMIVLYKVAAFSAFLARRFVKLGHVGMVNLLSDKPVVPELLQEKFTPKNLVAETQAILDSPARRKEQLDSFQRIGKDLSKPAHSSKRAATEILKLLKHA